jgi:hypothetical protein
MARRARGSCMSLMRLRRRRAWRRALAGQPHSWWARPAVLSHTARFTGRSPRLRCCTRCLTRATGAAVHPYATHPLPVQAYHIHDAPPALSESMHHVHAFSTPAVGSAVVDMTVHPGAPSVFAVAYDMGCVAVYVALRRSAVAVWGWPQPVVALAWLPGHACRCAGVTACGRVLLHDLSQGAPRKWLDLTMPLPRGAECVCAAVSTWAQGGRGASVAQDVLMVGLSTGACIFHVLQSAHQYTCSEADLVESLICAA